MQCRNGENCRGQELGGFANGMKRWMGLFESDPKVVVEGHGKPAVVSF